MIDKNCLSYWFPTLKAAGVTVPRTEIVRTDISLAMLLDGKSPIGFTEFVLDLHRAIERIGGPPAFLRTGQGSGKHLWKDTCYVDSYASLSGRVASIVEWSECVDFMGLPYDLWAVREMLPVEPICLLPSYGNMPLVREVRCFIAGGNVTGWHPYWPTGSIEEGFPIKRGCALFEGELPRDYPSNINDIIAQAHAIDWPQAKPIAEKVAAAFASDGEWSVDILETRRGWYVTDMAQAARSFKWVEGMRAA